MKKQQLWIGFLLLLLVWLGGYYGMGDRLIPNPFNTFITLIKLILSGELLLHGVVSLYRLTVGVLSALVMGVGTGILMGNNTLVEKVMAPIIYVMFPVPKAALLPIIFVFFGLGDLSKIVLIYLILYFQLTLAVYDGVKAIPKGLLLSATTLQLKGYALYRHVIFPAILPNVLSALRVSVGIGFAVLFFAETYATNQGLGYFIMTQWSLLNYEGMYAGILLLGTMGYGLFRAIDWLRYQLVKWT